MNHEHPLCAHLFHYDPCSDANTSFFALSSNIPFLVYITLVPPPEHLSNRRFYDFKKLKHQSIKCCKRGTQKEINDSNPILNQSV